MSTTIITTTEPIDINVVNDIVNVNVTNEQVEVNIVEEIIQVSPISGAYPLPSSVYSVFGRVGNVVGAEGDYNINELGDVQIDNPIIGDVLTYNGTSWINQVGSAGNFVPYNGAINNVNLGTYGLTGDFIGFNTSPSSVPTGVGTLSWDAANRTLQLIDGDGDTTLQIGQEERVLVHNNTGSTLTDGQVVYVIGSTGELPSVALASNTLESTSSVTFGIVTEQIAQGDDGFITTSGIVHGLNTLAFTEGAAIYLGATAGTFTQTKPVAPAHSVLVGYVIKKSGGNGSIFVKIQNGYELQEIHNVLISSVANNDGLFYDSATSLWKNKSIASVLGYTPANDSLVVKLAGDQSIYGYKSFGNSASFAGGMAFPSSIGGSNYGAIVGNSSFFQIAASNNSTMLLKSSSGVNGLSIAVNGDSTMTNVTATSFIKSGGTSSQFLKADGSVDTNSYALDSLVVKLAGTQTITGDKTFNGANIFNQSVKVNHGISIYEGVGSGAVAGTNYAGMSMYNSDGTHILTYNFANGNASALLFSDGANYNYTMPSTSGTIALTSDIPSLSGYVTLATDQTITGVKTFNNGFITDSSSYINEGLYLKNLVAPFAGITGYTSLATTKSSAISSLVLTHENGQSSTLSFTNTSSRVFTFPNTTGTIALTSDIPSLANYVTLNGTQTITGEKTFSTGIFGDNGLYLKENGSYGGVSGYASITSESTSSTAKKLVLGYGGANGIIFNLNIAATRTYTFPSANGTIALTSDLSSYLPLTGGTLSGSITATSFVKTSGTSSQFLKADGSVDTNSYYLNSNPSNFISSLTGEATATGPNAASVTLNNASVTGKVLTGVNITGGTISATDSMLTAFGKLQNQINSLVGGTIYQTTWNASTNTPSLTSSVGTKGYYYIVSVSGSTNLDGITDWKVGDWAIYDGTSWQKVDNSDAVSSVNGQTGAVSLTTDNIAEGSTNLYYLNSRARGALSFVAGSGAYNSTTGVITIPTNNNQILNGAAYITLASLSATAPISYNNTTGAISISQATTSTNGYLSSTDWNTFNGKQSALTNPVTGTGTTNYVPKFTGTGTIGNSTIQDDGTNVSISGGLTASSFFRIFKNGSDSLGSGPFFALYNAGASAAIFQQLNASNGLDWWTTYGRLMTLTANGRLLLGTSTESTYLLDVNGTGRFSGSTTSKVLNVYNAGGAAAFFRGQDGGYNGIMFTGDNSGAVGAMTTYNAKILIGSVNSGGGGSNGELIIEPRTGNVLTLASTGAATFSSSVTAATQFIGNNTITDPTAGITTATVYALNGPSSNNTFGIGIGAVRNDAYDIWFQTGAINGGGYRWYIGTTEKMTMSSTGNVGIGTTSPAYKLDVTGLGRFRDATSYEGAFVEGTNGTAYFGSLASDAISLYSGGVSKLTIKSTGILNIANVPTSTSGLVTGDIYKDGSGFLKIV